MISSLIDQLKNKIKPIKTKEKEILKLKYLVLN